MSFRVRVLRVADREVNAIVQWLFDRSPDGAARWISAFDDALKRLANDPQQCGLAPESEFVNYELRQIFFGTKAGRRFRAIFTIVDDEVLILHVRGPDQRELRADEI